QFTHDIIKQTIYDLIPPTIRSLLHKSIGKNLLEAAASNNPTIHLLAVAQINLFCKDGTPSPEERSQFASCNSQAAKYAIACSSFEEARSYIDAGIKMLEENHWETHYALSLDLFNMSASLCWMQADTATMAERLDDVIKHSKTFDDSLPASCLLVKLLASTSDFDAARKNCGLILSLGANIPPEVNDSLVQSELKEMNETLRSITYDQMKALPPMTNETKRNAMKVSNLLCSYSVSTKPMLVPIVACLMLKLTLQYGFCDDSIVGLASVGYSVLLFETSLKHSWQSTWAKYANVLLQRAQGSTQSKYRTLGERAVNHAAEMTSISRWNYESKAMLLQAELFYVDGDLLSAEAAYKASIMSAHEHKFVHEEALAYELHGVFCVENGMVTNGLEQLRHAKQKYEHWGATNVATRLQRYIDGIAGAKGSW
ncbi:hypothetical protein ACHAXT_002643, partial [Thalassiosira profunda]